jgi:hypothetical protein
VQRASYGIFLIGLFCTSFNKLNFYSSLMIFFPKPHQAEIEHQRLVLMMNDKIINFLLILWLFLNSCWVHNKNCWFLQKLLCVMLFWCCCLRSSIFLKFEKRDLLIHKILPNSDFFLQTCIVELPVISIWLLWDNKVYSNSWF